MTVFRVYVETKAGTKDEIGDGYSLGPGKFKFILQSDQSMFLGHGIIVSEVGGRHRVSKTDITSSQKLGRHALHRVRSV